jgi:enoyl-CoA hydratase/carnithine racemase
MSAQLPAGFAALAPVPELGDLETLAVGREGAVLVVGMDRPEVLNAYDRAMVAELRRVWRHLGTADDLRAAVLTAGGTRSFSTGLDVDDTLASGEASPSLDDAGRVSLTSKDAGVFTPVVVAVNGYCCAGGWHFVNDGDVVLAAPEATFFDTHVDVGLANPVEAVGLLSRLPLTEVLRMVASGRAYRMDAARAHQLGLVTEVVPQPDLLRRAVEIAAVIAAHPPELVRTSMETVWSTVLDQRAAAERLGLAMLRARHVGDPADRRLDAFRSAPEGGA